jgi:hypothetical protein
MSKVRVQSFAISLDGYGAGPDLGYECEKYVAGERAAHVFLRKRA